MLKLKEALVPNREFANHIRTGVPYSLSHIPIKEMKEGQNVSQCFLVRQKTQRATRSGDAYLEIVLADYTGSVAARAWAGATQRFASGFAEGDFVYVEGRTETYRNALQVIVESIRQLETYEAKFGKLSGFDPGLLVPRSERNIDKMWNEIQGLVETIEPPTLRKLTMNLLSANEQELKEFPAAIRYHHAYIGGLLEHSLEVAVGVAHSTEDYPFLNRGLAIAGAILHDIGKIKELENPIAPRHSFSGQLIGHLLVGRDMIREEAKKIDWPDPRLPQLLEHIVISHHGELEFGSAVVPKTAEAIAVYLFDNLSAKLNMVRMHAANDTEVGDFTGWQTPLDRKLFKGILKNGVS